MKKFLVLCRAPSASYQVLRNASKEERQAVIDRWMAWRDKHAASILDQGGPLGKSVRVTSSGAEAPTANDLGSFNIFEAESHEALAATLKDHPHLMSSERFVEIVEITPMPTA
jgi:hypothetical protein